MTTERIEFQHEKLGVLSVEANKVIEFEGLPGFPEARRFVLVAHDRGDEIVWLASLDDAGLAFPVVDLRRARADVGCLLTPRELAAVEAEDSESVELLAILNMCHTPSRPNLEAPLVIHRATRRGVQLIRDAPIELTPDAAEAKPDSDRVEAPHVQGPGQHAR